MVLSCSIWELMLRRMTGKIGTPSLQPNSVFRSFCWKGDSIATGAGPPNRQGSRAGLCRDRSALQLRPDQVCLVRRAPANIEHIRLAADLAVLDIVLAA